MATFTDLPPEIIALIISPNLIGYSTRRTFALTSKWACTVCHPSSDEIEHPIFRCYHYNLLDLAAREGHLEIMTYAMSTGDVLVDTMYEAALGGQLHVLEKYVEVWTADLAHAAIAQGHLNVFEYILKHGHPYNYHAFFNAASDGHLNVIRYICERDIPLKHPATGTSPHEIVNPYMIYKMVEAAVSNGHLHIIDWIFHNTSMFRFYSLHIVAIRFNQIIIVEWMIKHGAIMTSDWYKYAVSYKCPDIQNLLISAGCPLS